MLIITQEVINLGSLSCVFSKIYGLLVQIRYAIALL